MNRQQAGNTRDQTEELDTRRDQGNQGASQRANTGPGLSPEVLNQIEAAVRASLSTAVAEVIASQGNTSNTSRHQPEVVDDDGTLSRNWKIDDIGFFDPSLDSASGTGDICQVNNKTYFRNVDLFIESAEEAVNLHGASTIRLYLHHCLRGSAQRWYIDILSKDERQLLHYGTGIKFWAEKLRAQFREPLTKALSIMNEKFSVADLLSGKDPIDYATRIVRYSKATDSNLQAQLTWAWLGLDAELRRDIPRPDSSSTVDSFMLAIKDKQYDVWPDLFRRRQRPQDTYNSRYTQGPNSYTTGYSNRPRAPFQSSYGRSGYINPNPQASPSGNSYGRQQRRPFGTNNPYNSLADARGLPNRTQPLMITSGNGNPTIRRMGFRNRDSLKRIATTTPSKEDQTVVLTSLRITNPSLLTTVPIRAQTIAHSKTTNRRKRQSTSILTTLTIRKTTTPKHMSIQRQSMMRTAKNRSTRGSHTMLKRMSQQAL